MSETAVLILKIPPPIIHLPTTAQLKRSFLDQIPFRVEEVDIMRPENQEWHDKYVFDIPVISLDGKEIFRHRVDEMELTKTLQAAMKSLEAKRK
jgi:hypothetical protein